jgi:hypothetical protein
MKMQQLTEQLDVAANRSKSLDELRAMLTPLAAEARAPEDSAVRQRARRLLNETVAYNNARPGGREDAAYMKLLDEVKP